MFSDHYKFVKLFSAATLIIFLCFVASVKGNALALEKEHQFFYCLENATLCQDLSLSKWIEISDCKDGRLIAQILQVSREIKNKSFTLNISCSQFTIEERIRILGTFTAPGLFEVERFYIDNLKNTQIQWAKYLVSILGLLFAVLLFARNPSRGA